MPLLRLLLLGFYALAFFFLAARRFREASAAAVRAGTRLETAFWLRAHGSSRTLLFVIVALALTFVPRFGLPLAVVWTIATAPLAASGALRLLATSSAGLVFDGALTPWAELTGFAVDGTTRRLTLWWRSPDRPPRTIGLARGQLAAVAAALRPKLPEISPP